MTVSRSSQEMLDEVRATAQGFDVYGELGRRSDRDIWYLAREQGTDALVLLRLREERIGPSGAPEYSLAIEHDLDKEVPVGDGVCPRCRAPLRSFARFCGKCGADLTTGNRMPATPDERARLLGDVRRAADEYYDVLGELPWAGGLGVVYFALERATGRLVRLRLQADGEEFSLDETRAMVPLETRVLASYTSQPEAAGLPASVAPEPSPAAATPSRAPWRLAAVAAGVTIVAVLVYFALAS